MSTIRTIYGPNFDGSRRNPGFPATDQHPSAVRYPFDHPSLGLLNVDAIGGAPTQAEIDALEGTDATGQAAATRRATDETERQANAIDAQILSDLNMTSADITQLVDVTLFSTWTAAQRTFLKRLVRMVLAAARRALR